MRIYRSRINMLGLVKKGGVLCELGVLKGDFAEIILALCNPAELVLVDVWPEQITLNYDARIASYENSLTFTARTKILKVIKPGTRRHKLITSVVRLPQKPTQK